MMKKRQVPVSMRPVKTSRSLLIDKREKEEVTDCVYKVPCSNSEMTYIGETGGKFGTRLKEHKTEVEVKTSKPFTKSQRLSSLSEQDKSALTDYASHDNHVINWSESTILDRESDRGTRCIKEAVHIRKEGRRSMNRDEDSYTLGHTYDRFLATSHHYRGKNRKKN